MKVSATMKFEGPTLIEISRRFHDESADEPNARSPDGRQIDKSGRQYEKQYASIDQSIEPGSNVTDPRARQPSNRKGQPVQPTRECKLIEVMNNLKRPGLRCKKVGNQMKRRLPIHTVDSDRDGNTLGTFCQQKKEYKLMKLTNRSPDRRSCHEPLPQHERQTLKCISNPEYTGDHR
jgi:hypothetical protein